MAEAFVRGWIYRLNICFLTLIMHHQRRRSRLHKKSEMGSVFLWRAFIESSVLSIVLRLPVGLTALGACNV
jgi:hypothetical protein